MCLVSLERYLFTISDLKMNENEKTITWTHNEERLERCRLNMERLINNNTLFMYNVGLQ